MTTKIRTALSDKARADLIAFCAANLRPGLDPERYAENMDADLGVIGGEGAVFEIRGFDTASGNPATISFGRDDDFRVEDIDD